MIIGFSINKTDISFSASALFHTIEPRPAFAIVYVPKQVYSSSVISAGNIHQVIACGVRFSLLSLMWAPSFACYFFAST
jgi:hypothetical protein